MIGHPPLDVPLRRAQRGFRLLLARLGGLDVAPVLIPQRQRQANAHAHDALLVVGLLGSVKRRERHLRVALVPGQLHLESLLGQLGLAHPQVKAVRRRHVQQHGQRRRIRGHVQAAGEPERRARRGAAQLVQLQQGALLLAPGLGGAALQRDGGRLDDPLVEQRRDARRVALHQHVEQRTEPLRHFVRGVGLLLRRQRQLRFRPRPRGQRRLELRQPEFGQFHLPVGNRLAQARCGPGIRRFAPPTPTTPRRRPERGRRAPRRACCPDRRTPPGCSTAPRSGAPLWPRQFPRGRSRARDSGARPPPPRRPPSASSERHWTRREERPPRRHQSHSTSGKSTNAKRST